jgi:HemY protein
MKYLAWILGLFAAAVAFSLVTDKSAYVLLVYPPYRFELSLTFSIFLLLAVLFCGYLLTRFVANVLSLPSYIKHFRQNRATERAYKLQQNMLHAFFEGRFSVAEKAAVKAIDFGEISSIYPIIAARSAHELREYKKRDAYLSVVDNEQVDDLSIRLMTASKFMLDQRDPQSALKTLQELRDSGVKEHPGAMTLELKALQQTGSWGEVLKLLSQMEKRKLVDESIAIQYRLQAWLGKIEQQEDLSGLRDCLKKIPKNLKRRSKIVKAAVHALNNLGGGSIAQEMLMESLNSQWNSELVTLFGDCQEGDAVAQIQQAEKWLRVHQQDAGLLLALGKLCLHQKLWGKAQSYLDASLSVMPSTEVYKTLGQMAEGLGKADDAARYFQSAMKLQ